MTATFI